MISQLVDGLKTCNVHDAIQECPEQMKPLFCVDAISQGLDEDQFLDLFNVEYSQQQREKIKEISAFKAFSDFVAVISHGGLYKLCMG